MPRPALRTGSWRKIRKRIPGGASIIHYLKRKPNPAKCSNCGKKLHGVPRERPSRLKRLAKSIKRPNRAFGGQLCPSCAKEEMKKKLMK